MSWQPVPLIRTDERARRILTCFSVRSASNGDPEAYSPVRQSRTCSTVSTMSLKEPAQFVSDDGLTEDDRKLGGELNASLDRLSGLRAVEINVTGKKFLRSKIAWKLATYQHALLHRLVALMDGAAVAWNSRCTLSAMLSARALMETFAVMAEFERRVARLLKEEDLGGLDALAQNGIFASRDPDWIRENPKTRALNVLTCIDRFDRRCEGFRGHYDMLSERCHSNSLGHNFMFSELDRTDGTVRYCDEREPSRNRQMILAALAPLPLVESMMARHDVLIEKVSDLHHRVAPVGGAQQEPLPS
jgi:hypothetical protein